MKGQKSGFFGQKDVKYIHGEKRKVKEKRPKIKKPCHATSSDALRKYFCPKFSSTI